MAVPNLHGIENLLPLPVIPYAELYRCNLLFPADGCPDPDRRSAWNRALWAAESAQAARHAQVLSQAREQADRRRREAEEKLSAQSEAEKAALTEATPELAELLARRLLGE